MEKIKMFNLLILVLANNDPNTFFGYYKFYNNYGGLYYDYSTNGYHAISGSSYGADSNDVT